MNRSRQLVLPLVAFALACAEPATSPDQSGTTPKPQFVVATTGTWTLYPAQATTYTTAVQQPINADGSSNFKANGKGVIAVKFALSSGTGPAVFQSIGSDASTANDFSFLSFAANPALTLNDITTLSAVYSFTQGDCHGGSLRWQVNTSAGVLHIYYGLPPQVGNGGQGGCTPGSVGGEDQSGHNLIGDADLQYDTSDIVGGTYYDNYAHAVALIGTLQITRLALILDSGWQDAPNGDQRLTLTSGTVNDNTFTPEPASAQGQTCNLPVATIKITKTDGFASGDVNEPLTIQPSDNNSLFRTVDCKYMYNLATSSLSGVGTYKLYAVIGGNQVNEPAVFDLK
jgi:hypothetical protein